MRPIYLHHVGRGQSTIFGQGGQGRHISFILVRAFYAYASTFVTGEAKRLRDKVRKICGSFLKELYHHPRHHNMPKGGSRTRTGDWLTFGDAIFFRHNVVADCWKSKSKQILKNCLSFHTTVRHLKIGHCASTFENIVKNMGQ